MWLDFLNLKIHNTLRGIQQPCDTPEMERQPLSEPRLQFITPLTHASATSAKHMHTCKFKRTLRECTHTPINTHKHPDGRSSSHCSSQFPSLSSLVQVGRLESGRRPKLSTLLIIIVWQQTYRVKVDSAFPACLSKAWLTLPGTIKARGNCIPLQIWHHTEVTLLEEWIHIDWQMDYGNVTNVY